MQSSTAKKVAADKVVTRARAASGGARVCSGLRAVARKGLKRPCSRTAPRGAGARLRIAAPPAEAEAAAEEAERALSTLQSLKAIVVNLDRRPDRMEGCAARLQKNCPGLQFVRFAATDGRATAIEESEVGTSWNTARNVVYQKVRAVRKGWDDLDTYQVRQLELSPGERGCSSSHIRAWQHCLELAGDSEKPLMVLEDDAAPTPEFAATLHRALAALPADAHLLYLGYSQAADWRREVSPELVESEYVWTTVGYIVWPAGARLLLSHLPVNEPVDNWMAALCAEGDIKAYCVQPKIVHQADAWNVNSDVAHSDEHYWGPNSDIHHSDEFYWGPTKNGGKPGDTLMDGSCFWDIDSDDSEDSCDDV
eukprot:CAMPEP_0204561550 /NCGR_PEP_ID=MMETSP0661-20131031/33240_1 /ASSEMBLY_ACC=CAM_ASM_000606 /TAXON_ID=109239 /ORGANISM="Alexandrium margalefi, Strain AMGDE01CS-322" /LENGTH=365 /DNA_ID=CAMNT_0051568967 /DNA_START=88 /DNA_END=1185 /DNA_ORIENTATION=+